MKIKFMVMALLICGIAGAQDFKIAKNTGRLEISIGRATLEGYNGNEIVFSSGDRNRDKDKRAEGLRAVNGSGLEDNTGLGINVSDKGGVIEVHQIKSTNSPDIKIMVPKGMIVSYSFESQYGGEVKFMNMENEIEVSVNYNSVVLENVTGPLTIKTVYGHIEGELGAAIKDPISIVSVYGYVDLTLPLATKANVRLSTSYGEILVAPEFKLEVEKQGDMIHYSDKISGKINGGGLKIDVSSNYGKVYLRKK